MNNRRRSSINLLNTERFHFGSRESRKRINYPPSAEYSKIIEALRNRAPSSLQCNLFCGGKHCKYENIRSSNNPKTSLQGIDSNWITDDIIAMTRPNKQIITITNLIQQFHSSGIRSIINLQCPGEHASCGPGLIKSTGFTYDPTLFMNSDIYYYNFPWKDYGDASLASLLNMVKVICFSVEEGRVAIHCHAGLGRTGVLIACYLVYTLRVRANDAIRLVRKYRPHSVESSLQIQCVQQFEHYILPQTIHFTTTNNISDISLLSYNKTIFTLRQYLYRQNTTLHGFNERAFKHLPKIIYLLCERVLSLCGCKYNDDSIDYSVTSKPFTDKFIVHELRSGIGEVLSDDVRYDGGVDVLNASKRNSQLTPTHIYNAFTLDYSYIGVERSKHIKSIRLHINKTDGAIDNIDCEEDPVVLCSLLFDWIEGLKRPVIDKDDLTVIVTTSGDINECSKHIDLEKLILIEYLLHFIARLKTLTLKRKQEMLKRLIASLTQQRVIVSCQYLPSNKHYRALGCGTLQYVFKYIYGLLLALQKHMANDIKSKDLIVGGKNILY